jgi:hypothetical protein
MTTPATQAQELGALMSDWQRDGEGTFYECNETCRYYGRSSLDTCLRPDESEVCSLGNQTDLIGWQECPAVQAAQENLGYCYADPNIPLSVVAGSADPLPRLRKEAAI